MLDRLVAVGIVAHVHYLHLADFVDDTAIVRVVKQWRNIEYGVEHGVECILAAHEVDQSLRVVEY